MSTTRERLRRAYPEFESATDYPDDELDDFIGDAADELDSSVWGQQYTAGVIALAAHLLKIANLSSDGGAAAGPVSSKSVGPVSVSFDTDGGDGADGLNVTKYGREFARLKRKVAARTAGFGRFT